MSTTTSDISTRTTLFVSRRGREAFEELTRLESLYLATIRRKLGVALFFSSGPSDYSVIAYAEKGQEEEVAWLRANAKESEV